MSSGESAHEASAELDVERLRGDFPLLERCLGELPLIYLDSAATSLKPRSVITALADFYTTASGSVQRGVHRLGRETTALYRQARCTVGLLIGAEEDEIVFVANTTAGIHLIAQCLPAIQEGRVVATLANHHSGLLPWRHSAGTLRYAGVQADGSLDLDDLERQLVGAALLAIPLVSNVLGQTQPVREAVALARQAGALVLVDAAQAVPHMPIHVDELDADFLVFSGHKMLAPAGIGVLYGRRRHLETMHPTLLGGGMVDAVATGGVTLRPPPERFEAGTPNVGGAVALAAAIDYLEHIGFDAIHAHVAGLARRAREGLRSVPGLRVHGPESDETVVSAVSFGFDGLAAHALARLLSDRFAIMVRSGYHCAQPFHDALGLPETVRASFYLYNTAREVEALIDALRVISASLS